VEFIEVDNILTSTLGGEFALRMHCDVGLVAFVGKEWGYSGGGTKHCCRQILQGEGALTSCLAGSCKILGGTVLGFG